MIDHLSNARQKVTRAENHFNKLQTELRDFASLYPYETVVEPHPERPNHTVKKVRMTHNVPASIADTIADAVTLRSALDNAGYSIACAAGVAEPKHSAFPFSGSATDMAKALGRCKDVPKEIHSLFCGFQPYKGGNDLLWALNEVANTDKHKIAIPVGQAMLRRGAAVHGSGYFRMPEPHVWDRTKNEMELIELGPGATYQYDFEFRFFIAFHDIEFIDGKPIVTVLHEFGCIVQRILLGIEAECKRLGIF